MKNLVVIENFYKDPWAVREYALKKAQYMAQDQLQEAFAGTESIHGFYSADLVQKMERALGEKIDINPKKFAFGVFSKTTSQDEPKKCIHVDGSEWTGVLYLSRPEDCKGGTAFYRHKDWGWDAVPRAETLQSSGYASRQEFIDGDLKKDSQDFSRWQVSARVGMKFNRLVLFRSGALFHAADGYFGETDENCRLMQLFFFNVKEQSL